MTDPEEHPTLHPSTAWQKYRQTMERAPTLMTCAKADDVAGIERLLAMGADIDARDVRGYSALMLAAYSGNGRAFALLLERGADPNTADDAGNSVLMGASFKGQLGMVKALLAAGADGTAKNASGLDAHGFAAAFGRAEVAEFLESVRALTPE
jgi:hypothetical protein